MSYRTVKNACSWRIYLLHKLNHLLKQVKLRYETIHDPGHSGLGSIVVVVVTAGGCCGFGRGLDVAVEALVSSQHTVPPLQFEVCGINTDGLSQNAAIIFKRQKPGHFGPGLVVGLYVVVVVVVVVTTVSSLA